MDRLAWCADRDFTNRRCARGPLSERNGHLRRSDQLSKRRLPWRSDANLHSKGVDDPRCYASRHDTDRALSGTMRYEDMKKRAEALFEQIETLLAQEHERNWIRGVRALRSRLAEPVDGEATAERVVRD